MSETQASFESWAFVELMGHRKLAGRVSEEQRFGGTLGRVDVPQPEEPCKPCAGSGTVLPVDGQGPTCPACEGKGTTGGGYVTVYFGAGSVYALTPVSEAVARRYVEVNKPPAPVGVYDLQLPAPSRSRFTSPGDDDYDDD